ncbi:MAG: DUF4190 domain-containing protein [Dorea sp.]|nr:DUF4190 domain-containing protein [Dorea sp.]MDE6937204.1 DUF4190 domain-containing protein [Lachnospiraceae bacterium]
MARYVRDLVLNKPDDFVQFMMNDYLQKNSFIMSEWKGEAAYRAGDAMMEGYKYLKWYYRDGVFHLEAWLKGTFGGEWDLSGFVAVLQKKPYRESLEQLFAVLQQPLPMPQNMPGQGMPGPGNPGQPYQNTVPVHTVDNSGAATMGLVFGILSVVFAFIIPLVGIILACLGFSRARMGAGSRKSGQAKAGKVFCIIGIIAAIVMWGLNILLLMPAIGGLY